MSGESSTDDRGGASERYAVSMRASDGFNPAGTAIGVTRIEGVTHAVVAPERQSLDHCWSWFRHKHLGNTESLEDDATFLMVEIGETWRGARRWQPSCRVGSPARRPGRWRKAEDWLIPRRTHQSSLQA